MLPDDAKERRSQAHEALKQTRVGDHFTTVNPADDHKKLEPFSQEVFREAAIQWLIETDQVGTYISRCSLSHVTLLLSSPSVHLITPRTRI